jgi:hypothetical protein
MIPVRVIDRRDGELCGTVQLFDLPDPSLVWTAIEICFPEARTITRDNQGWSVTLGKPE